MIEENMFKILFLGWDDETYICKSKNKIFAITKTGRVLFSTEGQTCSKKRFEKNGKYKGVYLVKVKKDVFELYSKEGKKIDIV